MAEKKSISAKAVIADIETGITDEQLMEKYGLSTKGLASLKKKILEAGLLSSQEFRNEPQGEHSAERP